MKSAVPYTILCLFIFAGCNQQGIRYQDDSQDFFFRPLSIRAHADSIERRERIASVASVQVQETRGASGMQKAWQDSVAILAQSTKDLLLRIEKLEEIYIQARTRELGMEKQLSYVQNENRMLAQKMSEIQHAQYAVVPNADIPKIMTPAAQPQSMASGYGGALSLFWSRHYDESIDSFKRLLNGGIEDSLADHCEYWIGECHYAKKEFKDAVTSFEKVIILSASNKKADAFIMLGQSYEKIHETSKARWAYEELLRRYPGDLHAALAKSRLRSFQPVRPEKQNEKRSTT